MPLVTMITTAAGPEKILESGKSYNLSRSEATLLMGLREQDTVGAKGEKIQGAPRPACALAKAGAKAIRIPSMPDPEDKPEDLDDEDDILETDDE